MSEVKRRDFLKAVGGGVVGLALGSALGYTLKPPEVRVEEKLVERELKAAWVYVGPIGDYGWTHAHDVGRKEAEKAFPWLRTDYVENIDEAKTRGAIETFINKGYKLIFTTSFDHMNPTYEMALQYKDIIFFHCSGYKRADNMGTYFADFYQIYYLNGLMAGALTKTNNIGYVAAHLIPEVVRHINAFAIGVGEVNPAAKVYVIKIGEWYAPAKAKEAAATLVEAYKCDTLAFTEDSPATIEYAQKLYRETGKLVPVFSHYSPMYSFGPDVVPSGQVARWGVIYKDIIAKVYAGLYTNKNLANVDYWYLLNSGAVDLGAQTYYDTGWINPIFEVTFAKVSVVDRLTGERMSLLDLIKRRYAQMKDVNMVFDPFTGPLKGYKLETGAPVSVPTGLRLSHDDLWNMDWFLETVTVPK